MKNTIIWGIETILCITTITLLFLEIQIFDNKILNTITILTPGILAIFNPYGKTSKNGKKEKINTVNMILLLLVFILKFISIMKKLNLEEMKELAGGKRGKYFYAACGALAATVEFSIINSVWAAFHISAVAGCGLVGAIDTFS